MEVYGNKGGPELLNANANMENASVLTAKIDWNNAAGVYSGGKISSNDELLNANAMMENAAVLTIRNSWENAGGPIPIPKSADNLFKFIGQVDKGSGKIIPIIVLQDKYGTPITKLSIGEQVIASSKRQGSDGSIASFYFTVPKLKGTKYRDLVFGGNVFSFKKVKPSSIMNSTIINAHGDMINQYDELLNANAMMENASIITSDESWSNAYGDSLLHLRTCGVRPIGIGARHKAKLATWEACVKADQARIQSQKQAKTDAKIADTTLTQMFTEPGALAPGPTGGGGGQEPTGIGMAGWIGISVGVAAILGTVLYLIFKPKKGAKAAVAG